MRKKTRVSIILIIVIVIVAAGAWYFFFRSSSKKETSKNNTNQVEDLGYDSVLDTSDLSKIDPASAVDALDLDVQDYAQPDVSLEIELTK
ncbi:MAG: hypothetical protein WC497_03160 [Patescibacteria group bacterium]